MIKKFMKKLLNTIISHLKKILRTLCRNTTLEIFILYKKNLNSAIEYFKKATEVDPQIFLHTTILVFHLKN